MPAQSSRRGCRSGDTDLGSTMSCRPAVSYVSLLSRKVSRTTQVLRTLFIRHGRLSFSESGWRMAEADEIAVNRLAIRLRP